MRGYVAYPRIDILRISAILTDTDRIRILISLFERIQILCHEYSTDMDYAFILFYLNFILCILSTLDTGTNCKLSSVELSTHQDKSVVTPE